MRVADYIAACLVAHGLRHVFTVTGGGAMHLNDALSRNKELTPVCLHHEQACAMAAEAYCRLSGRLAVVNVTTGPGGINALNGVHGAYTDSIGMVVISGQVKCQTLISTYPHLALRQLGDQEADIISMVQGITKYAVLLREPKDVRYVMEKALYLASTGRPGPVWIDVPVDVQGARINPDELRGYTPEPVPMQNDFREVAAVLRAAKRPARACASPARMRIFWRSWICLNFRWPPRSTRMMCCPTIIQAMSESPARWVIAPGISRCRMRIAC
jgi:acetolactate synthase-1/2/3 large subunit